jgi:hypothetical protein
VEREAVEDFPVLSLLPSFATAIPDPCLVHDPEAVFLISSITSSSLCAGMMKEGQALFYSVYA